MFTLYYFSHIVCSGVCVAYFVLKSVYFLILCCDFHFKPMLCLSYLQLFVGGHTSYFCNLCLFAYNGVKFVLTTSITCGCLMRSRNCLHLTSGFLMASVFLIFLVFCVVFCIVCLRLVSFCPMLPEYLVSAFVFFFPFIYNILISRLSINITTEPKQFSNYCILGCSLHFVITAIYLDQIYCRIWTIYFPDVHVIKT